MRIIAGIAAAAVLAAGVGAAPAARALPVEAEVTLLDAVVSVGLGAPVVADLTIVVTGDSDAALAGGIPGFAFPLLPIESVTWRLEGPGGTLTSTPTLLGPGTGFVLFEAPSTFSVWLTLPDGDPEADLVGAVDTGEIIAAGYLFDSSAAGDGTGLWRSALIGVPLPVNFGVGLPVLTVLGYGAPLARTEFNAGAARYSIDVDAAAVPAPAALGLLAAGAAALGGLRARRRRAA